MNKTVDVIENFTEFYIAADKPSVSAVSAAIPRLCKHDTVRIDASPVTPERKLNGEIKPVVYEGQVDILMRDGKYGDIIILEDGNQIEFNRRWFGKRTEMVIKTYLLQDKYPRSFSAIREISFSVSRGEECVCQYVCTNETCMTETKG